MTMVVSVCCPTWFSHITSTSNFSHKKQYGVSDSLLRLPQILHILIFLIPGFPHLKASSAQKNAELAKNQKD
jgi:hypothetical protein